MSETGRPVGVVTGASGGIGRWIALGLARAGCHVVLICRDSERGNAVAAWIASQVSGSSTEVLLADLSSLREAHRLGLEITAVHPRVNVLVNNAGMFAARRQVTAEGHDAVLAVNHLAPFVLTDAWRARYGQARLHASSMSARPLRTARRSIPRIWNSRGTGEWYGPIASQSSR